jgi:FKBP-type peptidyl-prolyl cis-trans isomerase FkpA
MKRVYYYLLLLIAVAAMTSCGKVSFKKTKSGLIYKIIPSGTKDSAARPGDWLKIHFRQTRNGDSTLVDTYGKMPTYQQAVADMGQLKYNPIEIFPLLKKGDSAVVVMFVDSLFNKKLNRQMPAIFKKGDRIELTFRVVDVFRNDSLYQKDFMAEEEKDRPRQMAEQQKQMEEQKRQIKEAARKETEEAEKSGEAEKQRTEIRQYLASKNITAQQTPAGTFVRITEQGTGPMADSGKFLQVKYAGRVMATDSSIDSGTYPFQLNVDPVIAGWHDGLKLFRQGGKGTLYIPGYRAYGKSGRSGTITPNAALIFDIELLSIGDSMPPMPQGPGQ